MKQLLILIAMLSMLTPAFAQSSFPYDSVGHQIIYQQTFRLGPKVKADDVYATTLAWFAEVPKFTHKNAIVPLDTMVVKKKNKNKVAAEEQFDNPRPLQMQDPAGGKLQAMGIIRYYSTGNSIKLLYLKYDIGVKVDASQVSISISNIRYFHYNPSSYKQVPLYNFSGGKPCEEVGTLEALRECQKFPEEFKALAQYSNKEINGHISDFKSLLHLKKYLNEGAAPAKASAKAPAKTPTAKGPAKPAPKAPVKK